MIISQQLQQIIKASSFTIEKEIYKYYLVKEVREHERHLQITRLKNEMTVITSQKEEEYLTIISSNPENWRLLKIRCGKPFYCQGFIATITSALAKKGIDITLTSTFEYDLIFVQEENLETAVLTLTEIGFMEVNN